MKIDSLYSYDISNTQNALKVSEGASALNVAAGDIIEGTVSETGRNTKVSFMNGTKELTFPNDSLKNAYVGEVRRFEVMGTDNGKLMLRDLGGIAGDIQGRAAVRTTVDMNLVSMADDFAETNGAKESEDGDNIERLTDEDYSELRKEGFSIEDFKAERLSRAIDRVKTNRAAKQKSIDGQSEELARERENVRARAARAVSAKYAANQEIIDRLYEADVPITDANIASIIGAVGMSAVTGMLTDNSFAYMIKNELAPSVKNIYTSVYSGTVHREKIDDEAWSQLEQPARTIVNEANELLGEEVISASVKNDIHGSTDPAAQQNAPADSGAERISPADTEDARWLLEYDIPLNRENLVYKKELEELKINGRNGDDIAKAAAKAIARGEKAEDALLISREDPSDDTGARSIEELTSILRIQEIRLSMIADSGASRRIGGLTIDAAALGREVEDLRAQVRAYYISLAEEIGAPRESADAAMKVSAAVEDIASAPLSLYAQTYSVRTHITLDGLGDAALDLRMSRIASDSSADMTAASAFTVRALGSYEASATEVRRDLGDSIRKAFDNVDSLIGEAGLEATEANRRAVRILGYNSMEITAESITEMKYYDAKITSMIEGMKPSVVMSMIRRGFNPLERDIDSINDEIRVIMDEEGYSAEERFSSFLVKMEENGQISDEARDAYIGIYRLLYQIEKNDGAAIGAALNSGRKLTLSNLLTEARTRNSGIDASIDDDTDVVSSNYANSITGQIANGFLHAPAFTEGTAGGAANTGEGIRYGLGLVDQALDETEPEAWNEALENEDYGELTLEQVTEKLLGADKHFDGAAQLSAAVRSVMMSGSSDRRFLRSLGIDDSVNNTRALEADPAMEVASKEELIDALESPETMRSAFDNAAKQAVNDAELEFLGGIAILSRGREIDEQLARYDLLGQMAGHEHYRLNVADTGSPARINLTIVRNAGNAGTVSLEVNTTDYRIKADLSLTIFETAAPGETPARIGRIDGRISTDSVRELREAERPLTGFMAAMENEGYDTSHITSGADSIGEEQYRSRLGELLRRAEADTESIERLRNRDNVSTDRLYRVARSFLSFFL